MAVSSGTSGTLKSVCVSNNSTHSFDFYLPDVFNVASDSVIIRRHHIGEGFVVVEIAIAIFIEAFANHNAVHHNVAFAYEISARSVPHRFDRGLAVSVEIDCLSSWSGWTNAVKLHVGR